MRIAEENRPAARLIGVVLLILAALLFYVGRVTTVRRSELLGFTYLSKHYDWIVIHGFSANSISVVLGLVGVLLMTATPRRK